MKNAPISEVESVASELADHIQKLLDNDHSPFVLADAALIAGAPIWLEVTKSNSLAGIFATLAQRFALFEANVEKGTIN